MYNELPTIEQAKSAIEAMHREDVGKAIIRLPKPQIIHVAKLICDLYAQGIYSIESCCEAFSIKSQTFYCWAQPSLTEQQVINKEYKRGFVREVWEMYTKSIIRNETNYFKLLKHKTREGLLKVAAGFEVEESDTTIRMNANGQPEVASINKRKKVFAPNVSALIFVAKNVDAENFADKIETKHTGSIGLFNPYSLLSDEELQAEKNRVKGLLDHNEDY